LLAATYYGFDYARCRHCHAYCRDISQAFRRHLCRRRRRLPPCAIDITLPMPLLAMMPPPLLLGFDLLLMPLIDDVDDVSLSSLLMPHYGRFHRRCR